MVLVEEKINKCNDIWGKKYCKSKHLLSILFYKNKAFIFLKVLFLNLLNATYGLLKLKKIEKYFSKLCH